MTTYSEYRNAARKINNAKNTLTHISRVPMTENMAALYDTAHETLRTYGAIVAAFWAQYKTQY